MIEKLKKELEKLIGNVTKKKENVKIFLKINQSKRTNKF